MFKNLALFVLTGIIAFSSPTTATASRASDWGILDVGANSVSAFRGTKIWSWGLNRSLRDSDIYQATGVIGNGDNSYLECVLVQVICREKTRKNWSALSVGSFHACAVESATKYLYCWGRNDNGRLGIGTANSLVFNTAQKTTGSNNQWLAVSSGNTHTCGIKTDKTLWCWGSNNDYRLGDNTTTERSTPTKVATSLLFLSVQTGTRASCAITTLRKLYCWGRINLGSGNGDFFAKVPALIGALSGNPYADWVQVSMGSDHVCGLRSASKGIWCFGTNYSGQLARPVATQGSKFPVRERSAKSWSTLSSGSNHVCAIDTVGRLFCWGMNNWGQLGNGGNGLLTSDAPSREYYKRTDWFTVFAGGNVTCAKRISNRLYCWGSDSSFQLGYESVDPGLDLLYAVQCFPESISDSYLPKSCRPEEVFVQ